MPPHKLVAIIAGGAGSIGSATARAFAKSGMRVLVADLPGSPLDSLAQELAALDPGALSVAADITVRADVDRVVARALDSFGRIDILVNLAGVGSSPSLLDCTDEELERVVSVNLLGAARLMHAVIPAMRAQGCGSIINVGSVAGEAGVMGIYSAAKFGLRGLSDSVRREVKSLGIDVTLIEPGLVRSGMNPAMKGLPGPEVVVEAIADAVKRPRRIRIVPWGYRLPVWIAKTFPGLLDAIFGDARIQARLNRDSRAARGDASDVSAERR